MGPGLFNALNGLGAGGQVDSATSANSYVNLGLLKDYTLIVYSPSFSNSALYATFAVSAFFAG